MGLVFANNTSGSVTAGGTAALSSGSTESWTVTSPAGFPTSLGTGQFFHVADPALPNEKVRVTAVSGSGPYTWTVTRGDESTPTYAHASGFSVQQVVTAADFGVFTQAFNVRAYGARGDGVTDDTAAINAAITAAQATGSGGEVHFPNGVYITSANLAVTGDGIALRGDSRADEDTSGVGTVIKAKSGFAGTAIIHVQQSGTPSRPLTGITIEHLLLDGSSKTGTGVDGIYFQAYDSLINDVEAGNFSGNGIHVQGLASPLWTTYDTKVANCITTGNGGHGLFWDTNSNDALEFHCVSLNNGADGSFMAGTGHIAQGSHIYGNAGNGYTCLNAAGGFQLVGCEVESNGHHGLELRDTASGAYSNLVSGCHFYDNGSAANNTYDDIIVASAGAHGCQVSVTGCVFDGGGANKPRYGVNLTGGQAQACVVADNVFPNGASGFGTGMINANGNTGAGLACAVRGNVGFNPVGSLSPPGVPLTTVALVNPFNYDCTVYVKGGASTTGVAVGGTSIGLTSLASGVVVPVLVGAGQSITLTYTSTAPTWTWFAL